jgi:hypothetical protein
MASRSALRSCFPLALLLAIAAAAPVARAETLSIPGLAAPARVHTDALGVPHVVAETLEDAVRVQGYVHARDRFFQMDVTRRRAAGTLAELTGQALELASDGMFRPWGLAPAAERTVALMGDEERVLLQAYADGVNAWLAAHPLPGEYAALELTRVPPWSPRDSALVGAFFGWFFDVNAFVYEPGYTADLEQYVAAGEAAVPPFDGRALADEDVSRLAPLDPASSVPDAGGSALLASGAAPRARAKESSRQRLPAAALALARRHGRTLAALPAELRPPLRGSETLGSNVWAVGAEASATGTPLVANDPHTLLAAAAAPEHARPRDRGHRRRPALRPGRGLAHEGARPPPVPPALHRHRRIGARPLPRPAGPLGRGAALLQSLRDGLDRLASSEFSAAFGGSTSQEDYRWGRVHRVTLAHVLDGERSIPPAAGFDDLSPTLPGLSRDGAAGTLNVGGGFAGFTAGSNYRLVLAPGHPDATPDAVLGFAAFAGDFEDPLYASQLPLWLTVDHHPVPVSEDDVVPFPAEDAEAAAAGKPQLACLEPLHARAAAVGKAQGKQDAACLGAAAKGREPEPQLCLEADAKGKVAKARAKALETAEKKCGGGATPSFGYGAEPWASDAAAAASLGLVADLFGGDLGAAAIAKAADAAGAACQGELLKRAQKALETLWQEAARASQGALAGKRGAEPAAGSGELQGAVAPVLAPSEKVGKALAKLADGAGAKCGGVADLGAAFPGRCRQLGETGDPNALGACARARVLCRGCRSLNTVAALALPCDALDDGEIDQSCG